MGWEADADEPLLRRLRRVFATEERSFRMDRRSPATAALRAVVATSSPAFSAATSTRRHPRGELLLELCTFLEGWRNQVEGLHTLLSLKVLNRAGGKA